MLFMRVNGTGGHLEQIGEEKDNGIGLRDYKMFLAISGILESLIKELGQIVSPFIKVTTAWDWMIRVPILTSQSARLNEKYT